MINVHVFDYLLCMDKENGGKPIIYTFIKDNIKPLHNLIQAGSSQIREWKSKGKRGELLWSRE